MQSWDCNGATVLTLNSLQIEGQTASVKTCFPFMVGTVVMNWTVRRPQKNEKNTREEHTKAKSFHFHKTNLQPLVSLCKNIYVIYSLCFSVKASRNLLEETTKHLGTHTQTHTQAEVSGISLPRGLILESNLYRQSFQMSGTYAKMLKYQLSFTSTATDRTVWHD